MNAEIWKDNVRLVGAGPATVIKIPANATTATLDIDIIDGTGSEDSPLRIMGSGVTVGHLTLDGNGSNNTYINRSNDNDAYADGIGILPMGSPSATFGLGVFAATASSSGTTATREISGRNHQGRASALTSKGTTSQSITNGDASTSQVSLRRVTRIDR